MNKDLESIFPNPPAGLDLQKLDTGRIPKHIAVIMDGNGRWAKKRMLNRLKGHSAGIEAVRETIRTASDLGVSYLTIYSFSTENWGRPQDEVDGLMELFAKTMLAEVRGLHEENVRVMTIGDIERLPQDTRDAFEEAWQMTRENNGMTLVVAVNYGSRAEIANSMRRFIEQNGESLPNGRYSLEIDPEEFTEDELASNLYTAGIPDPELIIRTSGEMRLSNFLLWQAAYSELVCTEVLWPDFDRYEMLSCLIEYQSRQRRFGKIS